MKRWVQIVILICIIIVACLMLFVADFEDEPIAYSINHRIACPDTTFVVSLDEEGSIQVQGEPNGTYDWSGFNHIVSLASGYKNIAGITEDHTVVMTGDAAYCKNEVKDWQNIMMVTIAPAAVFGLKEDGTVVFVGDVDGSDTYEEISAWHDIVYIDAGDSGVAGVREDGTVDMIAASPLLEQEVEQWTDMKSLSVGKDIVIGLKIDGDVLICEVTADDELLRAYPYADFAGAVKVSAGPDFVSCLMPGGTVRMNAGLAAVQQQTQWEEIYFSIRYNQIRSAKNVVDINYSWCGMAVLQSDGTTLVKQVTDE
jgi:hypothetical protein